MINYYHFIGITKKKNDKKRSNIIIIKIFILFLFNYFSIKNYFQIQIILTKKLEKQFKRNKAFINNDLLSTKGRIFIDIDNLYYLYEKNIDFSNFTTDIKAIAFYSPELFYEENLNNQSFFINTKSMFKGHNQPRKPVDDGSYLLNTTSSLLEIIQKQVKLAKSHGIYGFAVYYYWRIDKILFEKPLKIYLENKNIDFPFFLVWKNKNDSNNNIFNTSYESSKFIDDIKLYVIDNRYIKINGNPVIGIYGNYKNNNYKNIIENWRKKSNECGIGQIYILINLNDYNLEELNKSKLFDAAYEFIPNEKLINFTSIHSLTRIYSSIIYFNIYESSRIPSNINNFLDNVTNNFPIFRCSMLEWDNSTKKEKKSIVFDFYSPEQFYILNKLLVKWTKNHYNEANRLFFINSWNGWDEGSYLEPDKKYGYSSINAFSRALFNIPYRNEYNISNLIFSSKIAVQAHIFYEDLLDEIIININNIPVKYDLYVTTISLKTAKTLKNNIKSKSNANKIEIKIVENKGRDILPFLKQLKNIIKKYKYICHIHSKKGFHEPILSPVWRHYLYDNLLGNEEIIYNILSEFEEFENLGLIFPENFFYIISDNNLKKEPLNKIQINYLLKLIFPDNNFLAGTLLDFPAGNMFWAKVSAIYQVFEINFDDKIPVEDGQVDCTILHGIERIWLYVAKINGYYYRKIMNKY